MRSDHVVKLRESMKLNREQLAVRAGISSRTVARIENGEGPVQRATLFVLADALGCDVTELIDDEEPVAA